MYNLDNRQYQAGALDWAVLEMDLGEDAAPNVEDLEEVLSWASSLAEDIPGDLIKLNLILPTGSIELCASNGLLHNECGPAISVRLPDYQLYLYMRTGLLHRDGAPAMCMFSNRSDFRCPKPKGVKDKPDRKWSLAGFTSYQDGLPVRWPLEASYNGVSYWDIDPTTALVYTHRVTLKTPEAVYIPLPPGDTHGVAAMAFVKGRYVVRDVDIYGMLEEYEHGVPSDRKCQNTHLFWHKYRSEGGWDKAKIEVDKWLEANLDGHVDPFHVDLFTDSLSEYRFLEEFQK